MRKRVVVRAPNVRPTTRRAEPFSIRAGERLRAWVARHIVADDPYDREDLEEVGTGERTPHWTRLGLVIMVLSACISVMGLIMLWMWRTG